MRGVVVCLAGLILLAAGCGSEQGSPLTPTVSSSSARGAAVTVLVQGLDPALSASKRGVGKPAQAPVPSSVTLVSVEVSGANFTTLTSTMTVVGGQALVSLTMSVKSGTSRTFIGRGYDAANNLLYSGTTSGVTLPTDDSATVTISLGFLGAVAPTVTTNAATGITTGSSATLNASVNPKGFNTAAYFRWGLTSSYGNDTPIQQLSSFTTAQAVTATVTGLSLGSTYYFQAVANNAGGTTFGGQQSFLSTNSWSASAAMPTGRFGLALASLTLVNTKPVFYAIGGTLTSTVGGTGLTSLTSYDLSTSAWREAAQMPTGRFGLAAGVMSDILYAVGGRLTGSSDGLTSLTSYNPTTNTWLEAAQMPTGRFGLAVGVLKSVLYAVGGTLTSTAGGTGLTSLTSYNPLTNTWVEAAQMPTGRFDLGVGVMNNVLYALGGRLTGSSDGLTSLTSYNPTTNTWADAAAMPTGRFGLAVEVINNVLYAVGGTLTSTNGGTGLTSLTSYNPTTNAWADMSGMPTGRFSLAAGALKSVLYAVGGRASGTGDGLTSLESFTPP